jgi:hypothetical protein
MTHDDCLFVGDIPSRPPLYLAIYVDDIIYFLANPLVDQKFQEEFTS